MNLYFYAVYVPIHILSVIAGFNPVKAKLIKYLCTDLTVYCVYWVQYVNMGVLTISMRLA